MFWYWKVRIHDTNGHCWHGQVATGRDLEEIDALQDAYYALTGCKMLLEGMSEREDENTGTLQEAFAGLWTTRTSS